MPELVEPVRVEEGRVLEFEVAGFRVHQRRTRPSILDRHEAPTAAASFALGTSVARTNSATVSSSPARRKTVDPPRPAARSLPRVRRRRGGRRARARRSRTSQPVLAIAGVVLDSRWAGPPSSPASTTLRRRGSEGRLRCSKPEPELRGQRGGRRRRLKPCASPARNSNSRRKTEIRSRGFRS